MTRYEDVVTVSRMTDSSKISGLRLTQTQLAKEPWIPRMLKPIERNMLDVDPPDHTRLRVLVHKAFSPRLIENMRERIQRLTDELLDAVCDRGRMDLIRDYALPLPTTIIGEMLGVPARIGISSTAGRTRLCRPCRRRWGLLKAIPSLIAFLRYIRRLVRTRRADPRDDLVSALVERAKSATS